MKSSLYMKKDVIFKLGELFCGPGGLALGAALSKPVCSKDGEKFSISHVWELITQYEQKR